MSEGGIRLDTPQGCVAELTTCNVEVAGFAHTWAQAAGELKTLEAREKRLYKAALHGTSGRNADERAAQAQVAVEAAYAERFPENPPLYERIEELVGIVARYRTSFEAIERRASNAQSILKAHREGAKTEDYVPREAVRMARAA
jgi:maltooligosyltrehalose synthase